VNRARWNVPRKWQQQQEESIRKWELRLEMELIVEESVLYFQYCLHNFKYEHSEVEDIEIFLDIEKRCKNAMVRLDF
jgi:hypothetical protein